MKKKLLFVLGDMNLGGSQRSLGNLLNVLDYQQYSVDLMLFNKQGFFLKGIPEEVNIIKPPYPISLYFNGLRSSLINFLKIREFKLFLKRILIPLFIRLKKNTAPEQIIWKFLGMDIQNVCCKYDLGIAYCQGLPTYFVAEKVKSDYKIAWMHSDYPLTKYNRDYDIKYYNIYNKIFTVSKASLNNFISIYNEYTDKTDVFHNIIDIDTIYQLAESKCLIRKTDAIIIVTVGRLTKQKGLDIAIKVMLKLIQEGYKVQWYIVGGGEEYYYLKKLINQLNLSQCCLLLGAIENPYPYYKNCDIYLQPSRCEGYCITLAEAKLFFKPIVCTNFTGAKEQIINKKTGLITNFSVDDIYLGLKRIIDNKNLRNEMSNNLKDMLYNDTNDLDKINTIINNINKHER